MYVIVLMRHKNCRQLGRPDIVMGHIGHGSVKWWVTWVTGHKIWPFVRCDMDRL